MCIWSLSNQVTTAHGAVFLPCSGHSQHDSESQSQCVIHKCVSVAKTLFLHVCAVLAGPTFSLPQWSAMSPMHVPNTTWHLT